MPQALYVRLSDLRRLIPPRKPRKLAASGKLWSLREFRRCIPAWLSRISPGDRLVTRRSVRRSFGIEPRRATVLALGSDGNIQVRLDGECAARWWHTAWFQRIPAAEAYRLAA